MVADCKGLCKNMSVLKRTKKKKSVSLFSGAKYKRIKVLSMQCELMNDFISPARTKAQSLHVQ